MLIDLTEQLNFINLEIDESIAKSQKSVELTLIAIDKLKKQFLKNKTEINELSIRGADFIMEDTQNELELVKSKFHMLLKEVKNGNNKSTN